MFMLMTPFESSFQSSLLIMDCGFFRNEKYRVKNRGSVIEKNLTDLIAATCRMRQWPQAVLQLVAAQEPQPDFPPAKADSNLRVFLDLHAGQAIGIFSSLERNSTSNSFLHFWHWNS
jgi:hypothetical protein